MLPFELGAIDVPGQWEARSQITLIEPVDKSLQMPLSGKNPTPKPRANILISRQPTRADSADKALQEFLAESAQAIPGLKRHGEAPVSFNDGMTGASVTISFNAAPQIRLAQRHFFRIDGGLVTQIVATVDEHRLGNLDSRMLEMVRTYTPKAG